MERATQISKLFLLLLCFTLLVCTWMKKQDTVQEEEINVQETDYSTIFTVIVEEEKGTHSYNPEKVIGYMMATLSSFSLFQEAYENSSQFWQAMAIVCRTNLVKHWEMEGRPKEMIFPTDKLPIASNDYFRRRENVRELVDAAQATTGIVLTYHGETIEAPFFYLSAGTTRNATEGGGEYPYLRAKMCIADLENTACISRQYYKKEEFFATLLSECPVGNDISEEILVALSLENITLTKEETGYVKSVSFCFDSNFDNDFNKNDTYVTNEITLSAETVQGLFSLPSVHFALETYEEGEKIGIVCNGIGHGYGLSLNYAEILAKEGHTYDEILSFFYTDIDFAKKW